MGNGPEGTVSRFFFSVPLVREITMRDSPAKFCPGPARPADFCPGPVEQFRESRHLQIELNKSNRKRSIIFEWDFSSEAPELLN